MESSLAPIMIFFACISRSPVSCYQAINIERATYQCVLYRPLSVDNQGPVIAAVMHPLASPREGSLDPMLPGNVKG